MESIDPRELQQTIDDIYRTESRRIFASLVRLLGDFDRAEEAMHEAFMTAVEQWEREGIPNNPRAWLVSAGRFKAIDAMRREGRFDSMRPAIADRFEEVLRTNEEKSGGEIQDDRLRLIFTCCHPAIDPKIQVPLTLREVCGLTTEAIASAFLTSTATMAQRLVRGKAKIRDAGIPIEMPSEAEFGDRLESILVVIYLVFSEGYSASSGDSLTRVDLTTEAIRLGRLLVELLPVSESIGLLALMLLQESRRKARTTSEGDIVLLESQDRTLWDRELIDEGRLLIEQAISTGSYGSYCIQAAIAAEHAVAESAKDTDWSRIAALYDELIQINASPVIELNRAVAISMCQGADAGLKMIDAIFSRGELLEYHLAHAARAELSRKIGRFDDAKAAYRTAISLVRQQPGQRFLLQRLAELEKKVSG